MKATTALVLGSLVLLSACATTQQQREPQIQRISPAELEKLMPQPTPYITYDELVRLSKAGTSPDEIIGKIKESNSRYDLTPSKAVELSKQGVNNKVLDYIYTTREQALRDGFAEELNKREKEKLVEQERLRRDYQLRYRNYDPFWGPGFGPYWGRGYYGRGWGW
ncbi:hypothetical protein LG201_13785 [Methylobacillus gramineus]|uniref:hypothetical protein n=1 Tax=Methylobacillus gramineus TaxID=755169 RepID=UPI001CFFB0D7|nr:hypothetical protein [Methylobacillus gramineus]MCB5186281.1 hypothetical protein [Methylobacillus gramineus]